MNKYWQAYGVKEVISTLDDSFIFYMGRDNTTQPLGGNNLVSMRNMNS